MYWDASGFFGVVGTACRFNCYDNAVVAAPVIGHEGVGPELLLTTFGRAFDRRVRNRNHEAVNMYHSKEAELVMV